MATKMGKVAAEGSSGIFNILQALQWQTVNGSVLAMAGGNPMSHTDHSAQVLFMIKLYHN